MCISLTTASASRAPFLADKADLIHGASISLADKKIGSSGASVLASACTEGALASCEELHLRRNELRDDGLVALSEMIGSGALPSCTYLGLHANLIGDVGAIAFGRALQAGALKDLSVLLLNSNCLGDAGFSAICDTAHSTRGPPALTRLEKLCLSQNQIGDAGASSLAAAGASGGFAALKWMVLERNRIGRVGMHALAAAITRHGAFPMCTHGHGMYPSRLDSTKRTPQMHIMLMDNHGDPEPVYEAILRSIRAA